MSTAQARARRRAERVLTNGRLVHPQAPHGTTAGYVTWTCRCVPCTAANTDYLRRLRSSDLTRPIRVPIPHGTVTGYTYHRCRCAPCAEASAAANRDRDLRRMAERVVVDGRLVHPDAPHGTMTGHRRFGCRCEHCARAEVRARRPLEAVQADPDAIPAHLRVDLHDMYIARRMSISAVARLLGRDRETVSRMLRRAGIDLRRVGRYADIPVPSESELAHYRRTMTRQQIADHYDVHLATVKRWLYDR